ncbi:hypothetical protein EG327_010588 [Venturia inaequalis]|uniref:Uncharacterized protein n=1 Tax=Venturia inaequalis TaxID=5025 RepID=A0A8H3VN56_VENIN|nr:hypothetical protein EG327_010588 [Venturia inaequalis]
MLTFHHIEWVPVAEALGLEGDNAAHTARMRFFRYREKRGDVTSKKKVGKPARKSNARGKEAVQAEEETDKEEERREDDSDEADEDEPIIERLPRRRRVSEAFPNSGFANADVSRLPSNKRAKKATGKASSMSTLEQVEDQNTSHEVVPGKKADAKLPKVDTGVPKKEVVGKVSGQADSEVDETDD